MRDDNYVRPGNTRERRRWCRGKKGILHQWQWKAFSWHGHASEHYEQQVCSVCGRKQRLRKVTINAGPKEPAIS